MSFVKQVEDLAEEIHRHVRRATGLACDGDLARAHGEAERAQGAARRFKELLGTAAEKPGYAPDPGHSRPPSSKPAHRKDRAS